VADIRPTFDPARMAWGFSPESLARVGLAHMHRRRFLSSGEAREWLARNAR
jgi:hypothetical protein